MANTFTPTDCYGLINDMADQMFGKNQTIQAVDTTTFVSVAEKMLRAGYTNTLDALGIVLARTVVDVRPYQGVFQIITRVPDAWGGIERRISFYSTKAVPTTNFNTDLAQPLKDGNSVDPWKIHKVYPLELVTTGLKTLQRWRTDFPDQLKTAFSNEVAFADYVSGVLTRIANDIQAMYDAANRLHVLNAIGATLNVGNDRQKVNMVAEYNNHYGTSKTVADLLGADFTSFMEFFVYKLQSDMELAKEENELFHIYPARTDDLGNDLTLLRHTPADMRRLILYMPIIRLAEKTVFPALFNDSYLKLDNYVGVEYFQNPNNPSAIDVTPNQLDVATGAAVNGSRVQQDIILGFFFDAKALETCVKIQDVTSTGMNAAGRYINSIYHWAFCYNFDMTQNMIVYYMAD